MTLPYLSSSHLSLLNPRQSTHSWTSSMWSWLIPLLSWISYWFLAPQMQALRLKFSSCQWFYLDISYLYSLHFSLLLPFVSFIRPYPWSKCQIYYCQYTLSFPTSERMDEYLGLPRRHGTSLFFSSLSLAFKHHIPNVLNSQRCSIRCFSQHCCEWIHVNSSPFLIWFDSLFLMLHCGAPCDLAIVYVF